MDRHEYESLNVIDEQLCIAYADTEDEQYAERLLSRIHAIQQRLLYNSPPTAFESHMMKRCPMDCPYCVAGGEG